MESNGKFVAQMLNTSALGYAGLATSLLFERHPEIAKRYEPDGFANWKAQLQRWILDLSAALATSEPKLFEARMLWTKSSFLALEVPTEVLSAALEALRDTLRERLPEDSAEIAVQPVDLALDAVADPALGTGRVDAPARRAVLSFLEAILDGKPQEAIEQLLASVKDETSARDTYLEVLLPASRETGRLWHAGELSIAEEHVITTTIQRAMTLVCERGRPSSRMDKTVLLACVAGNVHEIGIRAIADFFEIAGWRAIFLGADVPNEEIARSVPAFDADVVVLAATLPPHLGEAQRAIEAIRALDNRAAKVIVGGTAFEQLPDLWKKIGADGYAATVEEAEPLGSRLTR